MSTVKVAINGFGRIGRLVFRQIYNMEGIDVVAINDLTSPEVLAHLLKYDSAQGRFGKEVTHTENSIKVNGEEVKMSNNLNARGTIVRQTTMTMLETRNTMSGNIDTMIDRRVMSRNEIVRELKNGNGSRRTFI